jgi:alkylation response protein AidB-like acyl-CoA dehydrogenase
LQQVPDISTAGTFPKSKNLLAEVRALRPLIESKAEESEINVRLDDEVMRQLYACGYMTMMAPDEVGGGEVEPSLLIDCVEEVSYADGSTGWASMASACGVGVFLAVLPDDGVKALLSSDNCLIAGSVPKPGTARPVDGGYLMSGRFSFASGGAHAGWFSGSYFVVDENGKSTSGQPGGSPYPLITLIPREHTKILGNWDVMGLIATGSYDYEFTDVFVPEYMIARESAPLRGGAIFTMGAKAVPGMGHTGFGLGVGRRALDEFRKLASSKQRPPSGLLSKHHVLQRDFADWTTRLNAARVYAYDSYNKMYESELKGVRPSEEMRANCRMATTHAVFTAAEAAKGAYIASGQEGLRNGSVLQRCFRDLFAATQHMYTAEHIYVSAGRIYLNTPGMTEAHRDMMTTTFTPPLE